MNQFPNIWMRQIELHLWQATLFGLAITLFMMFLPGPARLRHFAGCLGLLRFLVPVVLLAPLFGRLAWLSKGGLMRLTGLNALWMPPFFVPGESMRPSPAVLNVSFSELLAVIWAFGCITAIRIGAIRLIRGLRAVRRQQTAFFAAD
jgi:hypothetical protein